MDEFSCHVKVIEVDDQQMGATATLQYEDGGGVDIVPGSPSDDTIQVQVTEDAARMVKTGAVLELTLRPA